MVEYWLHFELTKYAPYLTPALTGDVWVSIVSTIDSRYIAVIFKLVVGTAQQLQS